MNESAILISLGVSGVLFHCLFKLKSLRDASISANVKFNWLKDYVGKDLAAIIMSFLSVLIWFFCFGEVSAKYSVIIDFKRVSFVLAGICGSYIIQMISDMLLNSAKKRIQKYVDVKTNISDIVTKTGNGASVEKIIEIGKKETGEDVTKSPPAPKDIEE